MIIDCVADLHGHYPKLEGGDLLIVAGDLTATDNAMELYDFMDWIMNDCCYRKRIVIAGNHDNILQSNERFMIHDVKDGERIEYLCDSGTEFEYEDPSNTEWGAREGPLGVIPYEKKKLKVWGSPWTLRFPGMNPSCMAFTVDTEEELFEKWKSIPDQVDILITHSPPHGMLDEVKNYMSGKIENAGTRALFQHIKRCQPLLHVFGHIHEGYGKENMLVPSSTYIGFVNTTFVNASHVNERYEPVNKPVRVVL